MNRSDFYANAEKFLHFLSPESTLELQKNEFVYRTLVESDVLWDLRRFRPVVAGTLPLGVATATSDFDVLLTSADLKSLAAELEKLYGAREGFEIFETEVAGEPSLIARFKFQGVPFEIFAQKTESVEQTAFRHFQVEERLLKIGGTSFQEIIRSLRAEGLKTEPAFAKVLGLVDDPYVELLNLHPCPESELNLRFKDVFSSLHS